MTDQPQSEPTIQALNARLKTIVEAQTAGKPVRLRGTAWDVDRTQSHHVRFRLRQGKHRLSCVVFRSTARQLPFWIREGQELTVDGHIQVDPVWGELQLVASGVRLERDTSDAIAFKALEQRAREAGWLDRDRKQIPSHLQALGLITARDSRAHTDVTGSLQDADLQPQIRLQHVTMTGPDTAAAVRQALQQLNADPTVDIIVIARGGGSLADLDAFNDWDLAQAIVHSRVPVLAAIGHRQDRTLAKLVADRWVPTPSGVGQELIRSRSSLRPMHIAIIIAFAILVLFLLIILARPFEWMI